jgi:3-deoxy-manno-octulosonate cytidylyltransferase (CMP-KDO synthetase)
MNGNLIVIPARYGSTRLHAKVLAQIQGKPVIQWVYEAAAAAKCGDILVATDNKKIIDACKKFGAKALMTSKQCQSGTDRVYEAAKKTKAQYIINIQGDEPFISPSAIKSVAALLKTDKEADIVTACVPTLDIKTITSQNCVKAVLNAQGRALYFSRSVVPYKREDTEEALKSPYYRHCGIYGFKKAALEKFVKLPKSNLENLEKLEQLRALEAGMIIKAVLIKAAGPAIDTAEDLLKAKEFAKARK